MVFTKAPRLYRKNIGVQITNVDEFIAKADSGVDKMCKGVAFRMDEANQERSYSERRASSPSTFSSAMAKLDSLIDERRIWGNRYAWSDPVLLLWLKNRIVLEDMNYFVLKKFERQRSQLQSSSFKNC